MTIQKQLEALGLSAHQAAVYVCLVTQGPSQAGPIVKETKLHRALVYSALEALKDRGLVTVVHRSRVQFFQPSDPGILLEQVERLKTTAREVTKDIRDTLSHREELVSIRTLVGYDAFLVNLQEMAESAAQSPSKLLCMMGGAGGEGNNPITMTGTWYPTYVALCKQLGIKKHTLVSEQNREPFIKDFLPHPNNTLRVMSDAFSTPSFTRITDQIVSIEFYQPTLTVIQIRNKTIAQTYRDQFEVLWKQGTEVHV